MFFEVTRHNSPLLSYGSHGTGEHSFIQPCSLALDVDNRIFVVDTGNSRVKVLDTKFELLDHIRCPALEGRSVTGVCLGVNKDTLVTVNWRTKVVAEINFQGTQVMRGRISLGFLSCYTNIPRSARSATGRWWSPSQWRCPPAASSWWWTTGSGFSFLTSAGSSSGTVTNPNLMMAMMTPFLSLVLRDP